MTTFSMKYIGKDGGTLHPYSYPIPGVSVYRVIQGYLFFIVGETSCRLVTQI